MVNGRSRRIVRLDTGEILRVFARKTDVQTATRRDTLLAASRITDTPLDSPMTGTPLVYPSDVGTDATKFFITDADGTIWRFDVSSPDPTQWTGELYLDLYNQTVDTNATAWTDGQPLAGPADALDSTRRATSCSTSPRGTTDTFDSTGDRVRLLDHGEGAGPRRRKLRAFVNWYLATPLTRGDDVDGPADARRSTCRDARRSCPASASPGR